jgi:hypothetical protein
MGHPARGSATNTLGVSPDLLSKYTPSIFKVWGLEMFGRVQRDILGLCQ